MIEIKLTQGAKPGHGGVLPAPKVSDEISLTRGVPIGEDCISPSRHSAFSTPLEMMQFIAELRELSGGKPAGFKLCIGHEWEFLAICKAMLETGIYPDFIVVDGDEGGTGAAPLEFTDHIGTPMREGLMLRAQRAGRHRPARAASSSARRQDRHRASTSPARWRSAPTGATPRAASCSRVGCIQSQTLPHRPLPDRRRDAGPACASSALVVPRQGPARRQLPQAHGARAGRADRRGRPRASQRVPAGAHLPPPVAERDRDLRRAVPRACASASCWRAPTIRAG